MRFFYQFWVRNVFDDDDDDDDDDERWIYGAIYVNIVFAVDT